MHWLQKNTCVYHPENSISVSCEYNRIIPIDIHLIFGRHLSSTYPSGIESFARVGINLYLTVHFQLQYVLELSFRIVRFLTMVTPISRLKMMTNMTCGKMIIWVSGQAVLGHQGVLLVFFGQPDRSSYQDIWVARWGDGGAHLERLPALFWPNWGLKQFKGLDGTIHIVLWSFMCHILLCSTHSWYLLHEHERVWLNLYLMGVKVGSCVCSM